ncbi:DUF2690 domain-containing protein [Streptomyces achromogenes]|uniref:DUF2690 domain-containing protein n=1 Tax=Streptomyces achromogenes TaxID=67255 RepID=UPI00371C5FF1
MAQWAGGARLRGRHRGGGGHRRGDPGWGPRAELAVRRAVLPRRRSGLRRQDPQNQGCAEDAGTFKPTVGNPAHLQIRYSEDCEAAWAKIEKGSPGDQVTVSVTGGKTRTAEIAYGNDQFTHMVTVPDGEFRVTACAVPKPGGKSTFERYCIQATEATAWR